jgi:hypothetical protein
MDRFDEKVIPGCDLSDREISSQLASKFGLDIYEIPKEIFKVSLCTNKKDPSRILSLVIYYSDGEADGFAVRRDPQGIYIEREKIKSDPMVRSYIEGTHK